MIQLVLVAYNNKSYVLICEGGFALCNVFKCQFPGDRHYEINQ